MQEAARDEDGTERPGTSLHSTPSGDVACLVCARAGSLSETEVRFHEMLGASRWPIFLERDQVFVYANQAGAALVGVRSPAELIGRSMFDIVNPVERDAIRARVEREQMADAAPVFHLRSMGPDGVVRDVDVVGLPITHCGEHVNLGLIQDVTAQRQAERSLQVLARRLEALHEIDRAILHTFPPEQIAKMMISRVRDLVACDRASLILFDPGAGLATFFAVSGDAETGPAQESTMPLSDFAPADVYRDAGVVTIPDLREDIPPGFSTPSRKHMLERGICSVIVAPLAAEDEVLGVIAISSRHVGWFTSDDADVAKELADQITVAIRQARLRTADGEHLSSLESTVKELRRTETERRHLLEGLVNAHEEERRTIAADIHDDPVQKVVAASMRLDMIAEAHPELSGEESFRKASDTIKAAIQSLRHLMLELRPQALDRDGLAAALSALLQREGDLVESSTYGLLNEMEVEPAEPIRIVLYRIAQEALVNVRKHAKASRVEVEIRSRDGGFTLRVSDDGTGFDASGDGDSPAGHLGLTSMHERATLAGGRLQITSAPGEGTTIECWLPEGESESEFEQESLDP